MDKSKPFSQWNYWDFIYRMSLKDGSKSVLLEDRKSVLELIKTVLQCQKASTGRDELVRTMFVVVKDIDKRISEIK